MDMIGSDENYSRIYELAQNINEDSIKELSLLDIQMIVLQLKDRIAMLLQERKELRQEIKSLRFGDGSFRSSYTEFEELNNPKWGKGKAKNGFFKDPNREISSETKSQDLSNINNTSTVFYNKKIVISGIFERFPLREDLAKLLKDYGADINGSISSKTNIFIFGGDYGPVKMEKAQSIIASGANLELIDETKLYDILDSLT